MKEAKQEHVPKCANISTVYKIIKIGNTDVKVKVLESPAEVTFNSSRVQRSLII